MRDAYVWSEAIKDGIVDKKALTGGDKSVDGFVGVLEAIEALLETAEAPEEELAMDSPAALEVVATAFQGLVGAKAPVVHGQDLSVHLLKDAWGDVKGCTYTAIPGSVPCVSNPLMLVLLKTPNSRWERLKVWACALLESDFPRQRLVAEYSAVGKHLETAYVQDMQLVHSTVDPAQAAKGLMVVVVGRGGGADMAVLATLQMAAFDAVRKLSTFTHGASGLCTADKSQPGSMAGLTVQEMELMCDEPQDNARSKRYSRVQLHNIAHTGDPRPFATKLLPHWPPAVVGYFKNDESHGSSLLDRLHPDAVKSMYGALYSDEEDRLVCDAHTMVNLNFSSRQRWWPEIAHVPYWEEPSFPVNQWSSVTLAALDKEKPTVLTPVHLQWTRQANNVLEVSLCQGGVGYPRVRVCEGLHVSGGALKCMCAFLPADKERVLSSFDLGALQAAHPEPEVSVYLRHPYSAARLCAKALTLT